MSKKYTVNQGFMSLSTYLEDDRNLARLHRRRRRRAYAPTSNTTSRDNHKKISSWVSFSFLYGYGAPLGGPNGAPLLFFIETNCILLLLSFMCEIALTGFLSCHLARDLGLVFLPRAFHWVTWGLLNSKLYRQTLLAQYVFRYRQPNVRGSSQFPTTAEHCVVVWTVLNDLITSRNVKVYDACRTMNEWKLYFKTM